jgi:prevent-host-death family protein
VTLSIGVSIAQARIDFADLINRAAYGKERIVLIRHGKSVCALVPMESLKALEALEKLEDAADRRILAARRGEPSMAWDKAKKLLSKSGPRKSAR